MKTIALCSIFIMLFVTINAVELNVAVNQVRFLTEEEATVFDINYAIAYQELQFIKTSAGFEAILVVSFNLEKNGKQVYEQSFTNRILLTDQEKTLSKKEYSDKISLTLAKSDFVMNIEFLDDIQKVSKNWSDSLMTLSKDSFISDLEISTEIVRDTTGFMEKFHRGDMLYKVKPNHIFSKTYFKGICLYYELFNLLEIETDLIHENVYVFKKGGLVLQSTESFKVSEGTVPRVNYIDVSSLNDGLYNIDVMFSTESGEAFASRSDFFVIKESKADYPRFFPEFEEDIYLLRYFLNSKQKTTFSAFNEEAKKNYMERFWKLNDLNPSTKQNEFEEDIRERISYSNLNFAHHKDGWKTDRGRIYIKYGPPEEISKYSTEQDLLYDTGQTESMAENVFNINSKYAEKDYHIWKYKASGSVVYIFLDTAASGSMRLIYTDNDSSESSLVNWKSLLGSGFDESFLE